MLRGELIGLRAQQDSDIEVFEAELLNDAETRMRSDSRPWRPVAPGSASSPYRGPAAHDDHGEVVKFSAVELATRELAGEALLWAIDLHNRNAHIGLSLRPTFRGRHLGTDIVVPAGLFLGALAWAWRIYAITSGLGGIMASAPITFDARQWKRQVRTAKGLTEAPGAVPLLGRGGQIPVGGTIRSIGHRWHPVFTIPAAACARHMVIVGATGSGKTNLMMRLWAGWFTATLTPARAGEGHRPLLVVLDCKGGRDARVKADRTRRLLYGAGARRVAVWPDEARLSLWDLPPQDLAVLLYQMVDSGTGAAAYYADIMQAVLTLAVLAPCGPPAEHGRVPGPAGRPLAAGGVGPGPVSRPRRRRSGPRPGTCPTSSSATPPCCGGSAPPWTAPAPWPMRTPGTASWKAPANRPSPRRRPWR